MACRVCCRGDAGRSGRAARLTAALTSRAARRRQDSVVARVDPPVDPPAFSLVVVRDRPGGKPKNQPAPSVSRLGDSGGVEHSAFGEVGDVSGCDDEVVVVVQNDEAMVRCGRRDEQIRDRHGAVCAMS